MNILAHILLSGSNEDIILGNGIGDFVKGKQIEDYPKDIRSGIILHRKIDWYTDNHELVKQAKKYFLDELGHFAGIAVDIIFDHIIATHWEQFSELTLEKFADNYYTILGRKKEYLPEAANYFYTKMIEYNWLVGYRYEKGVAEVLEGMTRRSTFENKLTEALPIYKENASELNDIFLEFWNEINETSKTWEI